MSRCVHTSSSLSIHAFGVAISYHCLTVCFGCSILVPNVDHKHTLVVAMTRIFVTSNVMDCRVPALMQTAQQRSSCCVRRWSSVCLHTLSWSCGRSPSLRVLLWRWTPSTPSSMRLSPIFHADFSQMITKKLRKLCARFVFLPLMHSTEVRARHFVVRFI